MEDLLCTKNILNSLKRNVWFVTVLLELQKLIYQISLLLWNGQVINLWKNFVYRMPENLFFSKGKVEYLLPHVTFIILPSHFYINMYFIYLGIRTLFPECELMHVFQKFFHLVKWKLWLLLLHTSETKQSLHCFIHQDLESENLWSLGLKIYTWAGCRFMFPKAKIIVTAGQYSHTGHLNS